MKTYLINEVLTECGADEIGGAQFVATLTPQEWAERAEHSEYEQTRKDSLDIGSLPCELTGRLFFRLYSARIRDYLQ